MKSAVMFEVRLLCAFGNKVDPVAVSKWRPMEAFNPIDNFVTKMLVNITTNN